MIISEFISNNNLKMFHHTIDYSCNKTITFGPESHLEYEIMYVVEGTVLHNIEGRNYIVNPGDLIIININEIHFLRIDLNKSNYERMVLRFYENYLSFSNTKIQNLFLPFKSNNIVNSRIFTKKELDKYNISKIFYELCSITENKNKYTEQIIFIKSIELLIEINKIYDNNTKSLNPFDMSSISSKVIDYIGKNINKAISLEEIADAVFVDKFYMCHKFKEDIGLPITKYIIQKKIYLAYNLIKQGVTAYQASLDVGYTNYSSFFLNYKKIIGETPSQGNKN